MDYCPAAVAHIWSPGPSWSCRSEESFLLFWRLSSFFFLCVRVFGFVGYSLCPPLRHSEVFLNWLFSSRVAPKIRLDVGAQFFRDGKLLKHKRVKYSNLFVNFPLAVDSFRCFILLNNVLGSLHVKKTKLWGILGKNAEIMPGSVNYLRAFPPPKYPCFLLLFSFGKLLSLFCLENSSCDCVNLNFCLF